jgi:hypothetical protein
MAIKTFTTGEVLTASDTNTYLTNSGLVYIKQQTIGTAVSSVAVTGAFSTDYDAYKIILAGGAASAQGDITMILGSTVAGYYQNVIYTAWNNTVLAANTNNGASWARTGITEPTTPTFNVELVGPFLAERTTIAGSFIGTDSTRVGGMMTGFLADTTSYTGFTIATSTGTLTGGTIYVYGYRKA